MVAIFAKYIGPSNTKGGRIKATASGESVTVGFHSFENPYAAAAVKLCEKMGWKGTLVEGHINNDSVFVFTHGDEYDIADGFEAAGE